MSLQSFVEAFTASTTQHPFMRQQRVWQNVVVFEVKPDRAGYYADLNFIQSLYKNEGYGSQALDWLLALAREHKVEVRGYVNRCGTEGLTQMELRRWYKRHGMHVSRYGELRYTP